MSDSIYTYKDWKDCYQYVLQNIKYLKERRDRQNTERSIERLWEGLDKTKEELWEEMSKTKVELAIMKTSIKWIALIGGSVGTVFGSIVVQIILHYIK